MNRHSMYNDYQTLALYVPDNNYDFDETRAETIDAEVTFEDLYICGKYFNGTVKVKCLFDNMAIDEAYWVEKLVDFSGLEWVDAEGYDHSIKVLEITPLEVLTAIQALEIHDYQVREI